MSDRLERFARRLRSDPYFLASALEDYAGSERLDRAGLAAALGCEPNQLGPLGLCRRPSPDAGSFADDVRRIAQRFNLPEERLAEVVRRSEALMALREADIEDVVAAARDRAALPTPEHDAPS